jgi:RHS repeat-associated protein
MKEYTGSVRAALFTLAATFLCGPASAQMAVNYYHLDAVGNVLAVTNNAGAVVEQHDYDVFGQEVNIQAGSQPKRFTGKERDLETGWDYFGARYYGSKIGRFTSVDPLMTIDKNLANPQRWNRYAYGLNNPLKWVDRDGRDVSIAVQFTGNWSSQDRSSVVGRIASWYGEQGVGKVYVFDAATMEHGAWFASLRTGYASIEVTSASGDKQRPDKVFAGNYADLPDDQRLNAISNAVVHETAAHQFGATYGQSTDQLTYSRSGLAASDPQARARYGTVADSYAYGDEKTRSKVTGGPIPIHPADRRTLIENVGPSVRVKPPVEK